MATRATYQINQTVFYCHWDGYPEGAAMRFAEMVKALTVPETGDRAAFEAIEDRRGGFEYAFIRGVLDAEPTASHDEHGDTEHRYTVAIKDDGTAMIAHTERTGDDWRAYTWATRYSGELSVWLNDQRAAYRAMLERMKARKDGGDIDVAAALGEFPEIVRIAHAGEYGAKTRYRYATKDAAAKIGAAIAEHAKRYGADNPNKAGYERRAAEWFAAIPDAPGTTAPANEDSDPNAITF